MMTPKQFCKLYGLELDKHGHIRERSLSFSINAYTPYEDVFVLDLFRIFVLGPHSVEDELEAAYFNMGDRKHNMVTYIICLDGV